MEKKHFVMPARGAAGKYIVTFVSALVAAVIVIAVFVLVTGSRQADWLRSDNGAARENMFPFVFTSGDSLYVLESDLTVNEIDDGVANPVHDAELSRVYYTRDGYLFEYKIEKNTRTRLCGGVGEFLLLEERKSIFFKGTDGGIYIYGYNEKRAKQLRAPFASVEQEAFGESTENSGVITGEKCAVFVKSVNAENKTGALYLSNLSGKVTLIAENIDIQEEICIWENDSVISFYRDGKLVLTDTDGKEKASFENAYVVHENLSNTLMVGSTDIKEFGGSKPVRYIVSNYNAETGLGKLNYIKTAGSKTVIKNVAENVNDIVQYDGENDFVVYTVPEKNDILVYCSRKGEKIKRLTSCKDGDFMGFDINSYCLYIKDKDGELSFVDANDKKLRETAVATGVEDVVFYGNKPYTLFSLKDQPTIGVVIKTDRVESFPNDELRLYGKYDDKYIMCRLADDKYSLDLVLEDSITRICGTADENVAFDKSMENVLYTSNGELFLWNAGKVTSLGGYADGFKPVRIEAERK